MNGHRDPVEAWLSRDVELLPPPPGAFERVHRRARHRRAMKAVTAAAGAAVIIAAGVTVPQLVRGSSTGSPGPARIIVTPGPTSVPAAGRPALPGPPFLTAGGGPPPAARFRPTSVTFVGSTLGAVLGQAGSCGPSPCTAMAGTHDYGTTWTEISAPPAGPPDGATGVSEVRFLDGRNGWAYGPALYSTHNGGKTWRALVTRHGRVVDLSTVRRRTFAVVASGCAGVGSRFADGCTRFALFSTSASRDHWRPVRRAAGSGQAEAGGLQLTSNGGYLVAGGHLFAGPVTGGSWHRVRVPTATPACLTGTGSGPALIAPGPGELFLVCQDSGTGAITLYRSTRGGASWQPRGPVHAAGAAQSLAVSPGGALMLATTTGVYRSADARTWKRAGVAAPAGGFSFVGMTTDAKGVAIASTPGYAVYITTDGGLTWRARPIR